MIALAPYAANPALTRGRQHPEAAPATRNHFQRDRDRIIHSGAFRRLEYKTQVFINHEGDLFRTRLTHSLEVAQIGRAIARNLNLHEDLIEAVALAHDLGHTPFGHAGQDELNECMREFGGFEHNLQSLRVVDHLEQRYAEFDGLNLTYEVREGILKHCSWPNARLLGELGERFLNKQQPSLEAQVTNLADEIAYNNHDVDDGLRSGLITMEQLAEVQLFAEQFALVQHQYPALTGRRMIHETVRRMIHILVTDLCEQSSRNIAEHAPQTLDDVRNLPPLIGFSPAIEAQQLELKRFLRTNLYRHYQVNRMTSKSKRVIAELFRAFIADPGLLPDEYQAQDSTKQPRIIADYIAGMTDRYAIREYQRLFSIAE
ncbi:dGTPase [Methylobacillus rhizosphaerae]|uniref:Deoxyguanosinetriphosphate triphosphohydrolase-like protein n=1 Tax=Methylobacillus rhizosphaerae TaxID=551994 RepID=A0A238XTZ9_9PROT|nr:deoxyguanosinetriphosphate triphosphohydrolase [Methylobacillus rhizosphaerae]SNR61824.1 dGTPase [Methylobacillus rhizosphaerae]